MTDKIIVSSSSDPYVNIATEREIVSFGGFPRLFLWQNDKTVVIGRNQNPYSECDLDYMNREKILLARRFSGGGAVFHDLGNINYTLYFAGNEPDMETIGMFLKEVCYNIGFGSRLSGKNDLVYEGKKFSGHAFYECDGVIVFHGTFMVDVDLDMMQKSLKPPAVKIISKGIDSVRSRVVNLASIVPGLTTDIVKEAFIKAFTTVFACDEKPVFTGAIKYDETLKDRLLGKDWLYGETPEFSIKLEKRIQEGTVSVLLDIRDNLIKNAKIYSDSLRNDWQEIEKTLIGTTYSEDKVWKIIRE